MSVPTSVPKILQTLEFSLEVNADPRPQVHVQQVSLSDFLPRYPECPYTTFITVLKGTKVPFLDFHCTRLLKGFEILYPGRIPPAHTYLRDTLLKLLGCVTERYTNVRDELQIAIVLVNDDSRLLLCLHASHVPNPMDNIRQICVDCRGDPRDQPGVKNTSWYMQRKPLEAGRSDGVTETILVGLDNEGYRIVLEGLVTNIFVVTKTLHVWTAPAHLVLPGSVRACVLSACHQLSVPVHEKGIRLSDYRQFEAAFLTNARKFLVPIQSIHFPDQNPGHEFPRKVELSRGRDATCLINRLRDRVCQHLTEGATLIPKVDTWHM